MSKTLSPVPAVALSLVLALLMGCTPALPSQTPEVPPVSPTVKPTPAPGPIAAQVAALTTAQKVSQLLVAGIEGTKVGEDGKLALSHYQVGGIILFGTNVKNAKQLVALTNRLKKLSPDIPPFLCVDEEGGKVSRMPPEVTDVPPALDMGNRGDATLCRKLGGVLGAECAAFGFNMDFAPSLDIWSNPENTVIGTRAFGTTWDRVVQMALPVVQGISDTGVIPVVKHFPGHGDTAIDSHKALPIVTKTENQLAENELVPFQKAIDSGVPCVMVSHILLTQLDPEAPATLSYPVVTELLRQRMGFSGVVATDDLTMGALAQSYTVGEAAVLAVNAGCDLLLVCHKTENLQSVHSALMDAVADGTITEARLNESVTRILTLKAAYGLTADPVPAPDIAALNAQIAALTP
ncbi:MAG: beta-N-acetylhexosaminidase [Oscillospiraceae bacterium]